MRTDQTSSSFPHYLSLLLLVAISVSVSVHRSTELPGPSVLNGLGDRGAYSVDAEIQSARQASPRPDVVDPAPKTRRFRLTFHCAKTPTLILTRNWAR
jgi:hypothetical protein